MAFSRPYFMYSSIVQRNSRNSFVVSIRLASASDTPLLAARRLYSTSTSCCVRLAARVYCSSRSCMYCSALLCCASSSCKVRRSQYSLVRLVILHITLFLFLRLPRYRCTHARHGFIVGIHRFFSLFIHALLFCLWIVNERQLFELCFI